MANVGQNMYEEHNTPHTFHRSMKERKPVGYGTCQQTTHTHTHMLVTVFNKRYGTYLTDILQIALSLK